MKAMGGTKGETLLMDGEDRQIGHAIYGVGDGQQFRQMGEIHGMADIKQSGHKREYCQKEFVFLAVFTIRDKQRCAPKSASECW